MEFVEEKFIEIEEKVEFVEQEVQQVIEKELVRMSLNFSGSHNSNLKLEFKYLWISL